ncbi:MAG: ABC transporter permease [Bacteroides sp.]|nr:ABC transporter permease [Bacteroides sp.]
MITHYLKVAVRNLLNHKSQSLISLLGLAMAFACIALSIYWEHYERTYDAFHPNAERIYRIRKTSFQGDVSQVTNNEMKNYLKEHYPEVETACSFEINHISRIEWGEESFPSGILLKVTPEFAEMFQVEWLEGNRNMASYTANQIAVNDQMAGQLFGNTSPVGKKLKADNGTEYEVVATFKKWPKHTNHGFEYLCRLDLENEATNYYKYYTYLMLRRDIPHETFIEKLKSDTIQWSDKRGSGEVYDIITPLKEVHYTHPIVDLSVQIEHIHLFVWAALIVSLSALLNYLTLFISRIRNRYRNMALRIVHGSSGFQLFAMLMTEYLVLLVAAWLVGMLFIELSMSTFVEWSGLTASRESIYKGNMLSLALVLLCACFLSFIPIQYFKRKTLQAHIVKGRSHFRTVSVCIQLFTSLLFIFCSLTMYRQIQHLLHCDIGIQRKKVACVYIQDRNHPERKLQLIRQLPMIEKAMFMRMPLFPSEGYSYSRTETEDGIIDFRLMEINDSIAGFYGLTMKEGPQSFDIAEREIIINEAMAKLLNMEHPVGQTIKPFGKIAGVIHNFQTKPPTQPMEPIVFHSTHFNKHYRRNGNFIVYTYRGGKEACKEAVRETFKSDTVDDGLPSPYYRIRDGEDVYNEYLKSEVNLSRLLGCITFISIVIALFGVYALAAQSCEHRRKEIAIRKINGAKMTTILRMFFKEYLLMILTASVLAFPIGYVLMKRWLERYILQMDITPWMFVEIFLGITLLVVLCICWHIWKVANENPAEVVKSE